MDSFTIDTKNTYKKHNKTKGLHAILKELQILCGAYEFVDLPFVNNIPDLDIPKDLLKLLEFVFYNTQIATDIPTLNKRLTKQIDTYDINVKDLYVLRYKLDCICYTKTFTNDIYSEIVDIPFIMTLHVLLTYIMTYKYRYDKWEITGIDTLSNKVLYNSVPKVYDEMSNTFRTDKEIKLILNVLPYVTQQFAYCNGTSGKLDTKECISIYDRIDDAIRLYNTTNTLLGIEEKSNIDMVDMCLKSNAGLIFDKDKFLNRKRIASGNHIRRGDITMFIDEIHYSDNLSLIKVNYNYSDVKDTLIIPIGLATIVNCPFIAVGNLILDFYGLRDTNEIEDYFEDYPEHRQHIHSDCTKVVKHLKPFLRKSNTVSEEARKLAECYKINIPEGKTLVKEFDRHYYVKEGVQ